MSSPPFEVTIEPDGVLRRRVCRLAAATIATGVVLVLTLPLPWTLRGILAAGWLGAETAAAVAWARAAGCWRVLECGSDGARALFHDGIWRRLEARPGGVMTARLAWLRFATADRQPVAVLVSARGVGACAWRRLNLWWRFAGR